MSEFIENPRAFPYTCNSDYAEKQDIPLGMTLRDYFAAAALTGLAANPAIAEKLIGRYDETGQSVAARWHAEVSLEFADAMMAERAKP